LSIRECSAVVKTPCFHCSTDSQFLSPRPRLCSFPEMGQLEAVCFPSREILLVLPEYSIHSLFCVMFLCAQEWLTLGLNVPLLFYHFWRYFHCPADSSELAYDPPVVMNADTLSYCQKEAWCKLAFYLLSFFYYLYWKLWYIYTMEYYSAMKWNAFESVLLR
ncbi:hypothetical protein FD755_011996, partial [Muntiacus reevesi]